VHFLRKSQVNQSSIENFLIDPPIGFSMGKLSISRWVKKMDTTSYDPKLFTMNFIGSMTVSIDKFKRPYF
jgi:hypothetical protein